MLDGYELEPKAKTILRGLAFRERDFHRPVQAMSGGDAGSVESAGN